MPNDQVFVNRYEYDMKSVKNKQKYRNQIMWHFKELKHTLKKYNNA